MTYFELFEIPVQLKVDKTSLPRKYFALSRQFHPDFFANGSSEEQAAALENSALLNKAFRTLQNPDETIRYVLQLKGLLEEEEKFELPPAFLMEVMEINEALMEADDPESRSRIDMLISDLEKGIYKPVEKIITGYQEGQTTEEELLAVKAYYFKKKYLGRIRQQFSNTGLGI